MPSEIAELRGLLNKAMQFYSHAPPGALYIDFAHGLFKIKGAGDWYSIENEIQLRTFFVAELRQRATPEALRRAAKQQAVIDAMRETEQFLKGLADSLQNHQRLDLPTAERRVYNGH